MRAVENKMMEAISAYTSRIQQLISEGSWEDLNDILMQRQKDLESFFSGSVHLDKTLDIAGVIKKIQAEDAVSLRILQAQKKELETRYLSLKQNRKSVKAYQNL